MAMVSFILIVAALLAPQPASQQPASPARSSASLDYAAFKDRVQPILTTARKGNARCTACHSRGGGNSYLEELSPGSTTYNEEQSRRNFERVVRLVVPGEPLKSPLLVNPLAEEAGGSHWHGGGKHWHSQNDPEWQTLAAWVRATSAAARRAAATLPPRQPRHRVASCRGAEPEPRGLQDPRAADPHEPAQGQRPLHRLSFARRRQQLSGGAVAGEHDLQRGADAPQLRARRSGWSCPESRSRARCSSTRWPRRPAEATGTAAANTGSSQNDPEWQTLAAWVRGS